ncbi:Vesicle-associated protein 2-1 [Hibiscus syriacus]|uniref:Vesicle-associated protein 2-1 n=1 Tax=Hibiscus syriacus TaxID=106335 RepID=A0A6A3B0X7_HIBSY|nr:vesicle-associated protein 2-2-like isoform X1 [Hibiscus syriacus]XP_038994007.1 vesicle-associated protein 2-2-like isoform X1 [Hibiscus syriacus]XP_038994008.1 vesicle-associated protein 2-2-like isoform X1 [Hibiscus syriacus]XP_038994009.1 vesicle-associated protein 2-2-like isoform X1 [Hibiscus syriacus]KAE8710321.1 Vesicle-associated protein 2-1 [Hibiscus syriacus]
MNTQLLEIEPKELEFTFILKKPCSCSVRLTNNTDQNVAFKVKTTSPKKYCVRPSVGIIMPKSICEFTVTMQAQLETPPDMICGDKFLIQSTVVPVRTIDVDITSATFVKDSGRYIEEHKLKVAVVSQTHLPVSSTINGTTNQGTDHNASIPKQPEFSRVGIHAPLQTVAEVEESKMINLEDLKTTKDVEWKPKKDMLYAEDLKPNKDTEPEPKHDVINEDIKFMKDTELKPKNNFFNSKELKLVKDVVSKPRENTLDTEECNSVKEKEFDALNDGEGKTLKPVEELKFAKDAEEMKSKLANLEFKLGEAEATISKLTEERRISTRERKILEDELALLRKKAKLSEAKVGIPFLCVCMVALISAFIGYLLVKNKASVSVLYQL